MAPHEPNLAANSDRLPNLESVAVLPLRDWSSETQIYFSEAITDGLISSLAGIRPLQVTSYTSVRRYKDTDTPMRDIGRALGVAYIVDGNIVRGEERVQITTHLIDAKSDTQIWSKTCEMNVSDMMFQWLEKAFEVRARSLAWLQVTDELLPFAEDVRFQDLLLRIGIMSGAEIDTQARNTP